MTLPVIAIDKEDKVEKLELAVKAILIDLCDVVLGELCAECESNEEEDELKESLALRENNDDDENNVELETDPLCDGKLLSLVALLTVSVTSGDALLESLESKV